MIHLPKRLARIAELVDPCHLLADIGTDHGLLPIYLCQINKVDFAIASDIADEPLKKAKQNIKKYHLEHRIQTILTNGLINIEKCTNTIVIAGMGGHLIANIIHQSNCNFHCLILQPNTHTEKLRQQLVQDSYQIADETLVYDRKKYYNIIKAIKVSKKVCYTPLELEFGPILMQKKEPLFLEMYQNKLINYQNILNTMEKGSKGYNEIYEKMQKILKII